MLAYPRTHGLKIGDNGPLPWINKTICVLCSLSQLCPYLAGCLPPFTWYTKHTTLSAVGLYFRLFSCCYQTPEAPFLSFLIVKGPVYSVLTLPSRPLLTWDIKFVPGTNGCGKQEEYARAVSLWSASHDKHTESISNKIDADICVIVPKSQLYGCPKALCIGIDEEPIF